MTYQNGYVEGILVDPSTWLAIVGLSALALAGWLALRLRRMMAHAKDDRERLCDALERIGGGDYSNSSLHLECDSMREVEDAYGRMVPTIRKTIEKLEWVSLHDPLTALLNPASFKRACQAVLSGQDGDADEGALIYFDINDFKNINDSLGHDAGDRFLAACADRTRMLASHFKASKLAAYAEGRPVDGFEPIIGRLGGDEFAIFLPGCIDPDDLARFINRLMRLIGEPCQIGSHSLHVKISVGVALSADHYNAYDKLLAAADTAMYAAKTQGTVGHSFYNSSMRNNADRILKQELDLRTALQTGQFRLYFQPQLDLASNRIEGAEALIRWQHPTRGLVPPGEFIPFAETYDLIDEIGDWVVNEAIRTAALWWKAGQKIRIAINVSPKQLNRVELIPLIRASLKRYDLPPQALEVEITEAALMHDDEVALERIEGLRRDGVAIALDDFGTGYSNLAQLLVLPIDRLKIDRLLLEMGASGKRRRLVILAVLNLARKLGFQVVAEGVETESQLNFLRRVKCHFAQGYLLSPPLPEKDFINLVQRHAENGGVIAA